MNREKERESWVIRARMMMMKMMDERGYIHEIHLVMHAYKGVSFSGVDESAPMVSCILLFSLSPPFHQRYPIVGWMRVPSGVRSL